MTAHPRFRFFPFQADYAAQPNVFCPHLMVVAKPGYSSGSLNIDAFGFRKQYDAAGEAIDLAVARQRYPECELLLGNSTSFGVSLSGDSKTLNHLLQQSERPFINLSIRGAVMQQEVSAFLTLRHLLPRPKRIVLLTGICDASLTVQPEDLWSEAVGGMHSLSTFVLQYQQWLDASPDLVHQIKLSFLVWAEEFFLSQGWLQKLFHLRFLRRPPPVLKREVSAQTVAAALPGALVRMANAIHAWGVIARGEDIDVHVVLQPVLGWTAKPLHADEQACMDADLKRFPTMALYSTREFHDAVAKCFQEACEKAGLRFSDANAEFDKPRYAGMRMFSDICHLTDEGTAALASWLHEQGGNA